jgi:hypothetical protein
VKSALLLGDSFTEGIGAEPWFRQVAPQIERLNYQPINGGLHGTGFLQWSELERFLSANDIQIAKVIILFISLDVRRPIWNFFDGELNCLRSISLCRGTERYLRLPPASEFEHWVAKIRMARERDVSIKERIESALPATFRVYHYLRDIARTPQQIDHGVKTVINKLVEKYGRENVLFIQLPTKEELKGSFSDGLLVQKLIKDSGARYVDGISLCDLDDADYYVRDGHPNQQGYNKLAKCVAQIIESFLMKVD